jgi:hypothetical protein
MSLNLRARLKSFRFTLKALLAAALPVAKNPRLSLSVLPKKNVTNSYGPNGYLRLGHLIWGELWNVITP